MSSCLGSTCAYLIIQHIRTRLHTVTLTSFSSLGSEEDEQIAGYFTGRKCERRVQNFEAFVTCSIPEQYICDGISHCNGGDEYFSMILLENRVSKLTVKQRWNLAEILNASPTRTRFRPENSVIYYIVRSEIRWRRFTS